MITLYKIFFIYCKIYVTAKKLLKYLLMINNLNRISSQVIVIAYIKDLIADEYQSIVLKQA